MTRKVEAMRRTGSKTYEGRDEKEEEQEEEETRMG